MKNKKTIQIALCAILLAAAGSVSAATYTEWQYTKSIALPNTQASGYHKVKLDQEVLSHSSLNDLRVVSGGENVPYQLLIQDEAIKNSSYSSTMLDLSQRGNETMFIVDLGQSGNVHSRATILTSSKNFKRQVSVYAADSKLSHGDAGWRLLSNTSSIYNFHDTDVGFNAGDTEISYPASTSRYLRVVVHGEEGKSALEISGVRVHRYEVQQAEEDTFVVSLNIVQNPSEKTTELSVEVQQGIPTHAISFKTSETNFNRRVIVQASDDYDTWTLIAQSSLFDLKTKLFSGSNLTIEYPEQVARYIRVIVFNEDNKPIVFEGTAELRSTARYIVFNVSPGAAYELFYGNPAAERPRYDLARFFQYIETESLPVAELHNQMNNPNYVAPAKTLPPLTERYPYLLTIVLCVLVLIVGVFIVAYIRKLKAIPPTQ